MAAVAHATCQWLGDTRLEFIG